MENMERVCPLSPPNLGIYSPSGLIVTFRKCSQTAGWEMYPEKLLEVIKLTTTTRAGIFEMSRICQDHYVRKLK